MENIFIGMLLVFLDFTIKLDSNRIIIGLIPDFIGYILMMKGLKELIATSEEFEKAKQLAYGMAIYTGVLYAMDLFGISSSIWWFFSYALGAGALAGELVVAFWIIKGLTRFEILYNRNLQAENLLYIWKIRLAFSVAAYALTWIPVISIFALLGSLIVSIIYLAYFNRTKKLFYAQ